MPIIHNTLTPALFFFLGDKTDSKESLIRREQVHVGSDAGPLSQICDFSYSIIVYNCAIIHMDNHPKSKRRMT